jgi:hypothetical protein
VWTSTEGIYVSFDTSNLRLYFNDGSFWVMGCVSAGSEADAGTMYPTVLEDSNGNQILIRYYSGAGVGWSNSSARIQEIEDARAILQYGSGRYVTYAFTYDATNHLQSITNTIQTSEGYTIDLGTDHPLTSPFDARITATRGSRNR